LDSHALFCIITIKGPEIIKKIAGYGANFSTFTKEHCQHIANIYGPEVLSLLAEVIEDSMLKAGSEGMRNTLLPQNSFIIGDSIKNVEMLSAMDIYSILEKDLDSIDALINAGVEAFRTFGAVSKTTNNSLFDKIIQDIQDNTLSNYWKDGIKLSSFLVITSIINKRPDAPLNLIKMGVSTTWVVGALLRTKDSSYFNNFMEQIESINITRDSIAEILMKKCQLYTNGVGINHPYSIDFLPIWQQQDGIMKELIDCCSKQVDAELSTILECYIQHHYEADEL